MGRASRTQEGKIQCFFMSLRCRRVFIDSLASFCEFSHETFLAQDLKAMLCVSLRLVTYHKGSYGTKGCRVGWQNVDTEACGSSGNRVGFVLVGRQARDTLWTEGERLISSQDTA